MSSLQDLVPPLELCKQIPEGEFEDSALVWNTTVCDEDDGEIVGIHERDNCDGWMRENQIPAPTLEEILKQFDFLTLAGDSDGDPEHRIDASKQYATSVGGLREYRVEHIFEPPRFCRPVPTSAAAALKLWLEVTK